jgi:hypothetical protein
MKIMRHGWISVLTKTNKKRIWGNPFFYSSRTMNPNHSNEAKMYQIRVDYVYEEECDEKDPILRKLIDYCDLMKIRFVSRQFDPLAKIEDRNYITTLPAIQIYERDNYSETTFPTKSPIQKIRNLYEKLELQELERIAKQQIWEERIKHLKRIFTLDSLKTDSTNPKIRK